MHWPDQEQKESNVLFMASPVRVSAFPRSIMSSAKKKKKDERN